MRLVEIRGDGILADDRGKVAVDKAALNSMTSDGIKVMSL